ncbi:TetR family transcriptional regulator C-terminal domain-containing protein [Streptomyces sp. NPDC002785]|uniref:TetR family transcriptional regulator C-terminal domain-containing protein n=1 Tax=Streptomyces sp. NPDC002785 TaxID=3154543 RepID=UPI00333245F5
MRRSGRLGHARGVPEDLAGTGIASAGVVLVTDLESLLAEGVRQGRFAADLYVAARAFELLALLDGLSTRVVLGRRGADRDSALRMALSVTARLVERA